MTASLKEMMSSMELFRDLKGELRDELTSLGTFRQLRKGEHVFYDRDQVSGIYIVSDGLVSVYKTNSLGEKRIIFLLGPGQMINEGFGEDFAASANCEAFEDSRLICFNKRKFVALMRRDFDLTQAVLDCLSRRVGRLYRQLKNMSGSVRGDKRIAAKLWKLARDHGRPAENGIRLNLKLSVTCLANMLGAKRETISRQLKVLTDQNLVVVRNGIFVIPDPDLLAAYFKLES